MKRSASSSPVSDEPTAPTKAEKSSPKSKPKSSPNKLSGWTSEKKRALMEKIFDAGMASLKAAEVAEEIGITVVQFRNATAKGKTNRRGQVIKAAETLPATGAPF